MEVSIRPFQPGDETAVSSIITRCLWEVNVRDYSPDLIAEMAKGFTPDCVLTFNNEREIFVAHSAEGIVGTVSLVRDQAKYVCLTLFVHPERLGQKIGHLLMSYVEKEARAMGANRLWIPSSLTALGFYQSLGYETVNRLEPEKGEHWIWLTKEMCGKRATQPESEADMYKFL